jgi:hypothetical protein
MAPPSEFDLRAALAEGEGDAPNPNLVINAARARRAQRRSRILATVAVVALVSAGAVGIGQLGGTGGSSGNADSAAGVGGAVAGKDESRSNALDYGANSRDAHGAVLVPQAAEQALAAIPCPSFATADAVVGGAGGSGSRARTGAVFSAPVSSAVVCAYGPTVHAYSTTARTPARLELVGAPAVQLATSIETAPTTSAPGPCGQGVHNRYAFVAVGARGQRIATVAADLGAQCAAIVTNGVAVRYDWHPPPNLARRLVALTPMGVPASPNASPTN